MTFAVPAAALAKLGRDAEAGAELETPFEEYPTILDAINNWHENFRDDVIERLRQAGMPKG